MNWKKLGLLFDTSALPDWASHSALTPTPFILNDNRLRVYCGFLDVAGVSRIGYVDFNEQLDIISVSENPALSTGRAGCFDDNGIILGDVVRVNDQIRMYYVGFQLVEKVKFLAFSGLAISQDGDQFKRLSETPVLDRSQGATTIKAIHTALFEDNIWKVWYAVGNDWQQIDGVDYPKYNIWYTESPDGIHFPSSGQLCVDVSGDEYRIGRPSVYKINGKYIMFYTKGGTTGKDYSPGVAYSSDGVNWCRQDEGFGLELSEDDSFDSRHLCYPRLINFQGRWLAFYNGNDMGVAGFGAAELTSW